ncbi:MAG: efflux RND transporter periplasmic adaptor subunit [Chromatiaceae bacterium]|nr:efflux RND transporter periplasmic adaptor subunit [Chromatiaceae bacterium]
MKRRSLPHVHSRPLLAGTLVLLLSLAACDKGGNTYVAPPPPAVTVAHPVVQPVTDYLEQTGSASAVAAVDLVARVAGYLESVKFVDGSIVDKGELLFVIEQAPYEADVKLAEATLEQQQAQLTRATEEYKRQLRLIKQKASSQADVEKWLSERNSAAAGVDEAKANIEIAKINLGYTEVRAPFKGRISRHLVDAGNLVGSPGPTKLATIEQIQPIYAYFNVDEPTVLRIRSLMRKRGTGPTNVDKIPVNLGLQNEQGYPHKGRLDYVDTGIDPSTGTLQVRAVLPNSDDSILPGMFARVQIPVERNEHALLVRNRALSVDQAGSYLLVVNADDVVEQRAVELGTLINGMRVVTKGVETSDWVVVEGLQRATPGTKVTVTRQEKATAGAEPGTESAPAASAPESGTGQ